MIPFNYETFTNSRCTLKVVTRDGRPVQLVTQATCVRNDGRCICGFVMDNGQEKPVLYRPDGLVEEGKESPDDLMFVETVRKGWFCITSGPFGNNIVLSDVFESEQDARDAVTCKDDIVDVFEHEWTELAKIDPNARCRMNINDSKTLNV